MIEENKLADSYQKKTKNAYVLTRVLDTPFWGIFNLLPFILYKDLHASPFQLASLVSLKPLVSILSSYWAAKVFYSSMSLSKSIMLARLIAFLPFLFFPFVSNIWFMIASFGLFMFLQVGMVPAWMELLRQNVADESREKVFSYTQAFGYFGGGLLPFALGYVLDEGENAWRWTFFVTALIGMCSFFWQRAILEKPIVKSKDESPTPFLFLQPWTSAFNLLRQRPDFAKFQVGFMLIGSGLMIIQPVLPVFFVDRLHLSYTSMGISITLCKGIGFAVASPLWVRVIKNIDLFHFGSIVALLAVTFPLFLLGAEMHIAWGYLAYFIYGFMQSGNELSWNLSGPKFAKDENSSPFSNINVIATGVRGVFVPALGTLLLSWYGLNSLMLISCMLCFVAAIRMRLYSNELKVLKC